MTTPELETHAAQTANGWRDIDGFVGPYQPGRGPRSDPRGEFPTGPGIGERLPEIVARSPEGAAVDVLAHNRSHNPDCAAVVLFFRSAVW